MLGTMVSPSQRPSRRVCKTSRYAGIVIISSCPDEDVEDKRFPNYPDSHVAVTDQGWNPGAGLQSSCLPPAKPLSPLTHFLLWKVDVLGAGKVGWGSLRPFPSTVLWFEVHASPTCAKVLFKRCRIPLQSRCTECVCVCVVCIHALVSGNPAETGQRVRAQQDWRLPWWSSGLDSALPLWGAQVRSLGRELDPTYRNQELTCHS